MSALKHKRVTLRAAGADGSAADSEILGKGRSGLIRAIKVDYQNEPVTSDITIVDGYGNTIFTRTDSATDIALSGCGRPGVDESGAATAATDGTSGGWPFISGLTISVAQADSYAGSGNEQIVIDLLLEIEDSDSGRI